MALLSWTHNRKPHLVWLNTYPVPPPPKPTRRCHNSRDHLPTRIYSTPSYCASTMLVRNPIAASEKLDTPLPGHILICHSFSRRAAVSLSEKARPLYGSLSSFISEHICVIFNHICLRFPLLPYPRPVSFGVWNCGLVAKMKKKMQTKRLSLSRRASSVGCAQGFLPSPDSWKRVSSALYSSSSPLALLDVPAVRFRGVPGG